MYLSPYKFNPIGTDWQRASSLLPVYVTSFKGCFGCNPGSAMASAAACVTTEPACMAAAACMAEPTHVAAAADVADSVSHFISSEVVDVVDTLRRFRAVAMIWRRAGVSVMNIEMVVHVAAKVSRAVEPRAGTNENAAVEPLRTVVAVGSAVIRREVIVAIRTCGLVIEPVIGYFVCVGSRRQQHSGN
jgi:hypothetical protein